MENEEHVIGNWKESTPCFKAANNLAELCSHILQKTGLLSHNIVGQLMEEIKQSFEGLPPDCLEQNARGKNKLKKEVLTKKESELGHLENSQPIHIAKK